MNPLKQNYICLTPAEENQVHCYRFQKWACATKFESDLKFCKVQEVFRTRALGPFSCSLQNGGCKPALSVVLGQRFVTTLTDRNRIIISLSSENPMELLILFNLWMY